MTAYGSSVNLFSSRLCGISSVGCVSLGHIHLALLCVTILEVVDGDLREQSIGKDVLILLLVHLALFLELGKLRLDQVRGTAGDGLCILAEDLLDDFPVERLDGLAVLACQEIASSPE